MRRRKIHDGVTRQQNPRIDQATANIAQFGYLLRQSSILSPPDSRTTRP